MPAKYFNPYTDFGFKKLFGEEESKDLLQDFLNQLLPDYHQIGELNFKNVKDTYFNDGKIERTLEIAKNMLSLNLAIEIIAQTTGLTISEIEKLVRHS